MYMIYAKYPTDMLSFYETYLHTGTPTTDCLSSQIHLLHFICQYVCMLIILSQGWHHQVNFEI